MIEKFGMKGTEKLGVFFSERQSSNGDFKKKINNKELTITILQFVHHNTIFNP